MSIRGRSYLIRVIVEDDIKRVRSDLLFLRQGKHIERIARLWIPNVIEYGLGHVTRASSALSRRDGDILLSVCRKRYGKALH